jgi:hypothetical protein
MAKINVKASAYRVARGKAEIARESKWLKTAKLTTKKNLESKKRNPAEKGIDESEVRNPNITPAAEGPESSVQGKANEPIVPAALDKNTKRS